MKSLLIRAEDKNRWERRAPITPADLTQIIDKTGATAYVEQSEKRFFKAPEYISAGASLCDGMADGDVIFGVKEIPEEKILDGKTYLFFSHTIKGQKSGMPLLKKIIDSDATLIDYEKITDANNRRLVFFGRYAGDAGAIGILSLMGEYWAHHDLATPFAQCRRAHQYTSVEDAKTHMRAIGEKIKTKGLPPALSPMVIGLLGYGNVSGGAQQIFDCLPLERVAPEMLKSFIDAGKGNPNTVYLSIFKERDLVETKDGGAFDLQEYYDHPERYQSRFEPYLPYITILVNAVYWESRYPRFVTWDGLKRMKENHPQAKLGGIADITCDTHGSIECNERSTDSDMPAYLCDPMTRTTTDGHLGDGIVLLAVDNLPCELPNDASSFFSNQLKPLVPNLLKADYDRTLETSGLRPEIQKAVIVYNGKLTKDYEYLNVHLKQGI